MFDQLQGWPGKVWDGLFYLCGMTPPAVSRNWLEQNATAVNLTKWVIVIAVGGYVLIARQDERMKAHVDQTSLRFEQERALNKIESAERAARDDELRRVQLEVLTKLADLQMGQQKLQLEIIRTHPKAMK